MKIFYPVSPDQTASLDTASLRSKFLADGLFSPGKVSFVYSLEDRMIIFGVVPGENALFIDTVGALTGTEHLLDRREVGIINIGGPGSVESGSTRYSLPPRHVLYLGMGSEGPRFISDHAENPACFYIISVPAHRVFPAAVAGPNDAVQENIGSSDNASRRKLYKLIHPDGIQSCQLVMGFTEIMKGSVWNTMPAHSHLRRAEAYLYFDLPQDQAVMHFFGMADETRHLIVRNREVVLSPSWSIHSGVGTTSYTFVWAMAGENQDFTDMDHIAIQDLL